MDNQISMEHPDHVHPTQDPLIKDLEISLRTIFRFPVLVIIKLYQKTLSRALPDNTCRFYPSCSHYSYQAIYKYGVLLSLIHI